MKTQKTVWKNSMIISSIVSAILVLLLVIGLLSVEKIIMLPLLLLIVWGLYFLFCLYKFLTTKY
jgi:fatty acid desaturase